MCKQCARCACRASDNVCVWLFVCSVYSISNVLGVGMASCGMCVFSLGVAVW